MLVSPIGATIRSKEPARFSQQNAAGSSSVSKTTGEELATTDVFQGQKITKRSTQNGITQLETKTFIAEIGDKFQTGRDIKETAKLLRTDIQNAVKTGVLPEAKYSVRIHRFNGGESLIIEADNIGETQKRHQVKESLVNLGNRYKMWYGYKGPSGWSSRDFFLEVHV